MFMEIYLFEREFFSSIWQATILVLNLCVALKPFCYKPHSLLICNQFLSIQQLSHLRKLNGSIAVALCDDMMYIASILGYFHDISSWKI
jgi:hypothetical protein